MTYMLLFFDIHAGVHTWYMYHTWMYFSLTCVLSVSNNYYSILQLEGWRNRETTERDNYFFMTKSVCPELPACERASKSPFISCPHVLHTNAMVFWSVNLFSLRKPVANASADRRAVWSFGLTRQRWFVPNTTASKWMPENNMYTRSVYWLPCPYVSMRPDWMSIAAISVRKRVDKMESSTCPPHLVESVMYEM